MQKFDEDEEYTCFQIVGALLLVVMVAVLLILWISTIIRNDHNMSGPVELIPAVSITIDPSPASTSAGG